MVLEHAKLASPASLIGAAATIAVETDRTFLPITEYGDQAYFYKMYGKRSDYVIDAAGLWKWRGRGLIQLSGGANYGRAGIALKLPLLAQPELAGKMPQSARIFGWFWQLHNLGVLCDERKWEAVRRTVNGGTNGLVQFMGCVKYLGG